jgi:hypothetical protein
MIAAEREAQAGWRKGRHTIRAATPASFAQASLRSAFGDGAPYPQFRREIKHQTTPPAHRISQGKPQAFTSSPSTRRPQLVASTSRLNFSPQLLASTSRLNLSRRPNPVRARRAGRC